MAVLVAAAVCLLFMTRHGELGLGCIRSYITYTATYITVSAFTKMVGYRCQQEMVHFQRYFQLMTEKSGQCLECEGTALGLRIAQTHQ